MRLISLLMGMVLNVVWGKPATEFSITMDDPSPTASAGMTGNDKNRRILAALRFHRAQAALFVCGMRVDNPEGKALIRDWDLAGHLIANHSYSHLYLHDKKVGLEPYLKDLEKGEAIVASWVHFAKIFRFPFLKEGDTLEKRDGVRRYLHAQGYARGAVSVDASDWYISGRLEQRLSQDPHADVTGYRDFYLQHIWDRAQYYDGLSQKLLGRSVKHTLLVHHNLLNALFLEDLITFLKKKGWQITDAQSAFQDSVYQSQPDILPAGESLLWALAKQSGKFEGSLRYPGEDGDYEKAEMDKLGL